MSPYLRKYNTATAAGTHVRLPMIKAGAQDFAANTDWTPAAGDVKVSKDSAAAANVATLPSYVNGRWEFVFSAAELSCKTLTVTVVDAATKAVEDQAFDVETYGNAAALWPTDLSIANVAQTGDSYARLGAPAGASIEADIAAIFARIGAPAGASLSADIAANTSSLATLSARLSAARAGYLDNLNIAGAVASQADVLAINTSASKHVILQTVGQFERPEAGSATYTIEARTFSATTGAAVNADTTPTLTATGQTTGSLAANLAAATNPATGVYRWAYTTASNATVEPIRFDVSAAINAVTFTMSVYTQTTDFVSATFTATNQAHLEAIFNKLPSKATLAGTINASGAIEADAMTGTIADPLGVTTLLGRLTAPRAGYIDNLATAPPTVGQITADMDANSSKLALLTNGTYGLAQLMRTSAYTAPPTAQANALALLDGTDGVETGWTVRQAMRIGAAVLGGISSNNGATFRSIDNSKVRVTAAVDANGNRTSITLDAA